MFRRAQENGRSQPNSQSISQYKNTAETKLNCMALLSISEMIFLFNFFCVCGLGQQGGGIRVEVGWDKRVILLGPKH